MHCITVLPILKKTFTDTLLYWSDQPCSVGDIIQIKIQTRTVWAVVESIATIQQAKEYIKSRTFTIKRLERIIKSNAFSRQFILSVLDTSRYYVRNFGEIFSELVPKKILESLEDVRPAVSSADHKKPKISHIQLPLSERLERLKTTISENTFILCPTKNHKEFLKKKGLTNVFLPIDLYKLDTISYDACVLELASSEYYRHIRKDFDVRFFVRTLCTRKAIPLTESDTLLPLYRDPIQEVLNFTIPKKPDIFAVDMHESGKGKVKKREAPSFKSQFISPELLALIFHCQKNNESILLYTVRKGFSTQTMCSDCKTVLSCPTCKRPYRLIERENAKIYTCDHCHTTETTNLICPVCGNWNLIPLGASTEAVKEELQKMIDMDIVIIDSNNETKASAKKKLQQKKTGTIYIGTELVLTQSYDTQFTYSAIISVESLLALPSRVAEIDAVRVIYTLMERTTETVLVQMRNSNHSIWDALTKHSWQDVYTQIQNDTKTLQLPPYRTHIQIQTKNSADLTVLEKYISKHSSVQKTEYQNKETLHILLEKEKWPDTHIYSYLKSAPSSIDIQVDKAGFM